MITVIIPVYNGEKHILNILKDLNNQTFNNFEVIIINDGSIDNTKLIVEDNISKYQYNVKLISQNNKGVSNARNKGIKHSSGQYIAFIDADDSISKDYLEKLHNLIIEHKSDVSIVSVATTINEFEKKYKSKIKIFNNKQILNKNMSGKLKVGVCGTLISKKIISNNNIYFPEGYKYSEDLYFMWKIFAYSNKVVKSSEKLYFYKTVNTSAMGKFDESRIDSIKVYQELLNFFKNHNYKFYKKFKRKEIPRIYWSLAWQAAYHLEYNEFNNFINKYKIKKEIKKLLISLEIKVAVTTFILFISKKTYYKLMKKVQGNYRSNSNE